MQFDWPAFQAFFVKSGGVFNPLTSCVKAKWVQSTSVVTEFHTAAEPTLSSCEAAPAAHCCLSSRVTWEHRLWDGLATKIKGWCQLKLKWFSEHWSSTSKTVAKRNVPSWRSYWLSAHVDEYARAKQEGPPSPLTLGVLRQQKTQSQSRGTVILVAVQRAGRALSWGSRCVCVELVFSVSCTLQFIFPFLNPPFSWDYEW